MNKWDYLGLHNADPEQQLALDRSRVALNQNLQGLTYTLAVAGGIYTIGAGGTIAVATLPAWAVAGIGGGAYSFVSQSAFNYATNKPITNYSYSQVAISAGASSLGFGGYAAAKRVFSGATAVYTGLHSSAGAAAPIATAAAGLSEIGRGATTIAVVGTLNATAGALESSVRSGDAPTPSAAPPPPPAQGVGQDRFSVPNVSPGQNNMSGAFYAGLYGFSLRSFDSTNNVYSAGSLEAEALPKFVVTTTMPQGVGPQDLRGSLSVGGGAASGGFVLIIKPNDLADIADSSGDPNADKAAKKALHDVQARNEW